ncbi:ATP-binding protein [Larsenimonas rhizosphaerae]|uniref:ATP-binding protein n=1 Tax=Larsenimonas rhizosphaerae TaxID=2944682 RepID=UPI002033D97E|nr:ATP-binding protein [Larsenimonas rhizosphaerae]MCM2129889.1 ATP-binding protein [Larsenimonas rhizosphaerae]
MNDALVTRLVQLLDCVEPFLPPKRPPIDWSSDTAALWVRHPLGGYLVPVSPRDSLSMASLVGIERQREALLRNTRAFMAGRPSNHALLWGARGCGKSSLVRALINDLGADGLRLIQVDRHDLVSLPALVNELRDQPWRFIVYCDDLSFEGSDDAYKALKSVLDGTLTGPPENVLLYATSNRRHLLPESMEDNQATKVVGQELHHGDAVEEKISLSDRFGLWLSFYPFDQATFLEACRYWVTELGSEWGDEAERAALRFATQRGVRSGRAAWQFAAQWLSE